MSQQEAELGSLNGAAPQLPFRQPSSKQAFLRAAYQEGCAFQTRGQHREAANSFAAAVKIAPDFADALQNLGFSLFALGEFAQAAQAAAKVVALRPGDAGSHFNLGMALLSDGRAAEAATSLQSAARLDGSQAKHHIASGHALIAAGRKPEAVTSLVKAIELDPENTGLLVTLASTLIDLEEFNAAAGAAMLAIQQQPGNAHAHGALARALEGLGKSDEALIPARKAVRLAPSDGWANAGLGAVLYTLGHYAESLGYSKAATGLAPHLYQATINTALALEALGRLDEADMVARAALVQAPGSPNVRHSLALMLLASGRMTAEAWELYEARLSLNAASRKLAPIPRWNGEYISGKTILLHCEQGFGDTIQFLRYALLVRQRGARIILAVQPELLRLLPDLPGVDTIVSADDPLPQHDLFCPLLSLPRAFGTTLETIPDGSAYLRPPADLVEQWRLPVSPSLQVGLVWAGNTIFFHDRARSLPLTTLSPLAELPGITFHSLQKPIQAIGDFPLIDRMAGVTDFADTAAIIAGLDLVISVDSGVAHLAAAMGKEVWLLSRFTGCWRWLRNTPNSPWYPTLRVFGQTQPNDWSSVVERVREALAER